MTTESRKFQLGGILSIVTDRLFPPMVDGVFVTDEDHMLDDVYEIFKHMTGRTDLMPEKGAEICAPALKEQLPWLHGIDASRIGRHNFRKAYAELVRKYGEYHDVYPLEFDGLEEAKMSDTIKHQEAVDWQQIADEMMKKNRRKK